MKGVEDKETNFNLIINDDIIGHNLEELYGFNQEFIYKKTKLSKLLYLKNILAGLELVKQDIIAKIEEEYKQKSGEM